MSLEEEGYLILGVTHSGKTFRPSDWAERIATLYAEFDASRRLRYHPLVKPIRVDGLSGLYVDTALAAQDPAAFAFIMDFADSHRLQVRGTAEPRLDSVA